MLDWYQLEACIAVVVGGRDHTISTQGAIIAIGAAWHLIKQTPADYPKQQDVCYIST
jgi:hypothetical protein